MASKRGAKPAAPAHPPGGEASSTTPAPSATLHATLTELAEGQALHRVHQDQYRADQFNPGTRGNARFSTIQDDQGQPIPTLYGGTTMDCALMETVFHDVPHTAGFKSFDKGKLGITRKQLIDTEKDQYPATRKWAEALHRQYPDAQGLSWVSRQDDSARAVVLFGDRIPDGTLKLQGASRSLVDDGNAYEAVLDLADRIGVAIIPGSS